MTDKEIEEIEQYNKLRRERREKRQQEFEEECRKTKEKYAVLEQGLIKVFNKITEKETISDKELEMLPEIVETIRRLF